jgi:hypothetical protein
VVAVGSSSAKPDRQATERLRKSIHIMVALDFDTAGTKAWEWWKEVFFKAERWPVPKGKDPGEAHKAGVDLRGWVAAGLPPAMRINA